MRMLAVDSVLGLVAVGLIIAQATLLAIVVSRAFLEHSDLDALRTELLALCMVTLARGVVGAGFESVGRIAAADVMAGLRTRLVENLLCYRPGALSGERRGELAAAAVQGVDGLELFFARYLPQLVIAVLAPVAILAWTLPRDLTATVILAVTFPLIPVFMVLIGKAAEGRTRARWRSLARLSGHFLDVVTGLKTLRANARATAQKRAIALADERLRRTTMQTLRVAFLSALVLELLAMLGTALVAAAVGVQLANGTLGLEAGLTVLILAPELYLPLRQLGTQFHAAADGVAAAERIFEVLDQPPAVMVSPRPRPCPDLADSTLAVRELGYTYPGCEQPVLRSVSFELEPGETLALIGESGAGKTTLAHLLVRLADPTLGGILCGGTDLRELEPRSWRRQIAWIPQRPTIFSASVADNVRLYEPAAEDQRVEAALEAANALKLVRQLPDAAETLIGEGGRALSLGETQRIALARAFLADTPLVILDEPTAHLDSENQATVSDSIGRLLENRSGLLIVHRRAPAGVADRVVELEAGRLVERPQLNAGANR